jgi:hypothetical protein
MKRNNRIAFLLMLVAVSFVACMKPSVDIDKAAWGDNANITAAVLFRYDSVKNQLGYADSVTGYQNVAVSTASNVVDKAKATVTIVAKRGTDLTRIGIRFSHFAERIVPQNGAPAAGLIADFSKGPFVYRLFSADKTERDWTVLLSVE